MDLKLLLNILVFTPLIAYFIGLVMPKSSEKLVSGVVFGEASLMMLVLSLMGYSWFNEGQIDINIKELSIYSGHHYQFFIDFYFDIVSLIFLSVGVLMVFLISKYSRVYMHREEGYKRFFNTIQLFFLGYVWVVLSGNFETMFIGWEIIGLSSFLLISFYRDRYLPVKNALKVFSIYRLGDIGFILAMWSSHYIWHQNITFIQFHTLASDVVASTVNTYLGAFMGTMILLAAMAKSAQFPFTSWLPRAMEGPTPSSAIFYGSVAVHLGVFLMLRTMPLWESIFFIKALLFVIGLITAIVSTMIARVQTSIKVQIAYSSAAQIGLMFLELSLGLETLVLIHFAGNAFLRSYQLLISPSIVSYLIRDQFFNYNKSGRSFEDYLPEKWRYTIYMLSLKEWKLDGLQDEMIWKPLKNIGKKVDFIGVKTFYLALVPMVVIGVLYKFSNLSQEYFASSLTNIFGIVAVVSVFRSFAERKSVLLAWVLVYISHLFILLSVMYNEALSLYEILFYLLGVTLSGAIGYFIIKEILNKESNTTLNSFYGHHKDYKHLALIFLMSCLGLMGFPITSTFIGLDLLLSHVHQDQFLTITLLSICFVVSGISLMRMYARVFLGPHYKTDLPTPLQYA
jgi:NADH-quinone oxidoreductase subunit L